MEPGIHRNINADQYHGDPCAQPSLSSSIAKILLQQSPLHAWLAHPKLNPGFHRDGDSSRLDLGSVAHDVLLEGGTGRVQVVDPKDYPSKTGSIPEGWTNTAIREARDLARSLGKLPIFKHDWLQVNAMCDVAREFVAGTEIDGCFGWEAESTIIWQEDGLWFRGRTDLLKHDRTIIVDYKTTTNANPEYLTRSVICQMGYDFQASFYRRGVYAVTQIVLPAFVFLFQEIEPPYACSLVALDPMLIDVADIKVEAAIHTWEKCLRTNSWPAYSKQIHWAQAPAWALADAQRLEEM